MKIKRSDLKKDWFYNRGMVCQGKVEDKDIIKTEDDGDIIVIEDDKQSTFMIYNHNEYLLDYRKDGIARYRMIEET